MKAPDELVERRGHDPRSGPYYVRLMKALYGLKQSGRCWNELLVSFLLEMGFTRCPNDSSVFLKVLNGCLLLIYVDDLLIAGATMEIIREFLSLSLRPGKAGCSFLA